MNGWLKLHRGLLDNPTVMKSAYHFAVWVFLLCKATYKPYDTYFKGELITLKPGQLITSRDSIAKQLKIKNSHNRIDGTIVQRILKDFENAHQITQVPSPQNRLITLINWEKYQKDEQQTAQQLHNNCTTTAQQAHTNKEDKKNNNTETSEVFFFGQT